MKKLLAVLLFCMVLSIPAWALTDSGAEETQKTQEGMMVPGQMAMDKTIKQLKDQISSMMQICPKVMNQMDGMLSTMKDMAKLQEKILLESKDEMKKQEMSRITDGIDRLMNMMDQMMGRTKEAD